MLQLGEVTLSYALRKRKGHHSYTLSVLGDGRVVVTVPRYVTVGMVERFLKAQKKWLGDVFKTVPYSERRYDRSHYLMHREAAREFITRRLYEINVQYYNFRYKKISIRTNTSRWGSCSSLLNLNFDYRILFLPAHLQDYLLAHELCHLKEMNHSEKFWKLVERAVPEYRAVRRELLQHNL